MDIHLLFVIYDTEFTAWEGSMARRWSEPWEHRELIQLAALKIEVCDTGCQILESFSRHIKPIINPTLSQYVIDLTGITQTLIDQKGVSFPAAIYDFNKFCQGDDVKLASWGNDQKVLAENAELNGIRLAPKLLEHIDLSVPLRKIEKYNFQVCSGLLHKQIGIQLKGHVHDALHDVNSIVATVDRLVKENLISINLLDPVENC
ncbi:exonuclease domain-containing protein [Psychrosphaera sp. B3R10]|nr:MULTISPECIES: 3'-5' exonuclease [unclassified Psychrosphaera]MBU2884065.1 exonuclease domain-containing protein [Psychrosphaera sp. I2R16]MBU2988195.1 exonuclease domain-containing protein [Psychrosphaera sp. B3R10]MDO6718404.1 3'-5' exonuclease [Psychrosphaera sp. 1_MG-2023]